MRGAVFLVGMVLAAGAADVSMSRVCGKLTRERLTPVGENAYRDASRPIKKATLSMFASEADAIDAKRPIARAKTNRWGNFKFPKLKDGEYLLRVELEDGQSFSTTVIVNSKEQRLCSEQGFSVTEKGELQHWVAVTVD